MTKLQERFEEAENAAPLPPPQSPGEEYWWEASLNEFVKYINRKHAGNVWAHLDGSNLSETLRLRLAPFTRKNEAVTFLVLSGTKAQVTVLLANQHPVFQSREEFDDFLVKFLRLPNFRASLAELIDRNADPCEGTLRFGEDPKDRDSARDIVVAVPAEIQQKLAKAAHDGNPAGLGEFDVERIQSRKRNISGSPQEAKWLYSGGYFVKVAKVTDGNRADHIRLSGSVYIDEEMQQNAA